MVGSPNEGAVPTIGYCNFGGFMARDPVCFAEVDEVDATNEGLMSQQNGQTYFFCCSSCKSRFERDPGAFMGMTQWESTDDERPENFVG